MLTSTEIPTLPARPRTAVRDLLKNVLVEESRLAASTREYVWRVGGSPFQSIKRLFTEQGRQLDRWRREISERVCGVVVASPVGALDQPGPFGDGTAPREAVKALLIRHEAIIVELRAAVEATGDREGGEMATLLSRLLEFHETSAWILRLLLESPERTAII